MKFRCLVALLVVVAGSCSDTQNTITSQLNLDRPIDIAFGCFGGLRLTGGAAATPDNAGDIHQTAQPISGCDIRSGEHDSMTPAPVPPGQETINDNEGHSQTTGSSYYYGFILQNETGTVALAHWDTQPSSAFGGNNDVTVDDADPLIPGKNGIAVGEDPVAIASSFEGCYELTANAGSCDLSTIDITSAVNAATDSSAAASGAHAIVNRLTVTNAAGAPIRARPAAMVAQPSGGTIGVACPATPTGLVYIAYPSCHLVAGVDASTGTIVNSVTFDANGIPPLGNGNVSCPDECGGGGIGGAGARPVTLKLERDERSQRTVLAIGSQNSNVVSVVELDVDSLPTSVANIALEQNKTNDLGVTFVAVSPTIGMGGDGAMINDDMAFGGEMQFLYAITTDNTVRVVNIDLGTNKECDTQIDPRYLHDETNVNLLSCLPLQPAKRRAGARGPGVQLSGQGNPTAIDVFRVEGITGDMRADGAPLKLVGYFGVITASNGATYMLNVDNDNYPDSVDVTGNPIRTAIPLVIANQLRDKVPERGALAEQAVTVGDHTEEKPICNTVGVDPSSTAAPDQSTRYTGTTTRTLPTGSLATEKIGILPSIRQVECISEVDEPTGIPVSEMSFAAPLSVRDQEFPDLLALPYDDTVTMTYEGSLSIDTGSTDANGPPVRTSMMNIDADGIRLDDQTHPYCDAGVEPWDIVQLRGCDSTLGDTDCPIGYTCFVHPESQVANLGACMLKNEADRLAVACKAFLTSLRQYTVAHASSGELKLIPRKHVLRTTPVDGCTSDAQCQDLASFLLQNESSNPPISDTTPADLHHYSCAPDPARAPDPTTGAPLNRCIETCSSDADCDAGAVCDNGTCYDGVIPPQSCVNAPQRYEVRASEAFVVAGETAGYNHPIIADAAGNCVRDPNASRFDIGRIPLKAPACDPTANPFSGLLADGVTYEPNPCEATVDQTELVNNYVAGTCTPASPATSLVTRQATAIRYHGRGMTITLVDPTYPGDALCIGDRLGGKGNIPVVPQLFQESVRVVSGFSPLLINTGAAFPVKVVRGPEESIWIMDDGDYLSTSITVASTRGKVFRIESPAIGIINVLQ
ncbi:MAG TPA: hypothetical protein VFQ65_22090 [Kofleriaceae bacterium]|nr:hypothetical protein [Kofleriaceae bacterium]